VVKVVVKLLPALVVAVLVSTAMPAHAAVPVLVIDGEGYGHGVGMAQDGAYWMGRSGSTTEQIVGHFYPGVSTGRAAGPVRVVVLTDDDADTVLTFPQGGDVRSPRDGEQLPGFPIHVEPGGAVRVVHDTEYHVVPVKSVSAQSVEAAELLPLPKPPSTSSTTSPAAPTTTALAPSTTTTTTPERRSGTSIWAVPADGGTIGVPDRSARYRGAVEASAAGGPLRLVNELDVEQYLRGMGEVRDPSWPAASLRAQAIVARTYAMRAMKAAGEICDTQRCQVYLGQQAEYGAMDKAVTATAGRVLLYRGGFAAAVYSANGAGVSATPEEGFGTPNANYPYLRAAPYETHSPDPWEVRIALSDLAGRMNYRGELTDVRIANAGPSGRATTVILAGSAGERTIPAFQLADALGLRSTKWKPRIELGEAPPPPPARAAIQSLPEQVTAAGGEPDMPRHAAAASTQQPYRSTKWLLPLVLAALAAAAVVAVVRGRESGDGEPSPPFDAWRSETD
jgi:stage II sporulation protein D